MVKKTVTSVEKDVEKLEPSYIAGENLISVASLENSLVTYQKVKIIMIWFSNSTPM